jgi:hypothetical protein
MYGGMKAVQVSTWAAQPFLYCTADFFQSGPSRPLARYPQVMTPSALNHRPSELAHSNPMARVLQTCGVVNHQPLTINPFRQCAIQSVGPTPTFRRSENTCSQWLDCESCISFCTTFHGSMQWRLCKLHSPQLRRVRHCGIAPSYAYLRMAPWAAQRKCMLRMHGQKTR